MGSRRLALVLCTTVPAVAAAFAFAACVGDSPVQPGPDAATTDSTTPDADEPFEAGVEKDGGAVLDGGGNPDDTDSGVVIDAGKDAGTCGPGGAATSITSGCASFFTGAGGGSLATVSYRLTGYTVYGTPTYCSGTFKSGSYSGRLVITKNPNGSYNFSERVSLSGSIYLPPNTPNKNFTVVPSGGTDLTVTQTCGNVVSDTTWAYTSAGTTGSRTINYARTSGTATIKLSWTQE